MASAAVHSVYDAARSALDRDDGSVTPGFNASVAEWHHHTLFLVNRAADSVFAAERLMDRLSGVDYSTPTFTAKATRVYSAVGRAVDTMVAAKIAADSVQIQYDAGMCTRPQLCDVYLASLEANLARLVTESAIMASELDTPPPVPSRPHGHAHVRRARIVALRDQLNRVINLLRETHDDFEATWPTVVAERLWERGADDAAASCWDGAGSRRASTVGTELFRTAFT